MRIQIVSSNEEELQAVSSVIQHIPAHTIVKCVFNNGIMSLSYKTSVSTAPTVKKNSLLGSMLVYMLDGYKLTTKVLTSLTWEYLHKLLACQYIKLADNDYILTAEGKKAAQAVVEKTLKDKLYSSAYNLLKGLKNVSQSLSAKGIKFSQHRAVLGKMSIHQLREHVKESKVRLKLRCAYLIVKQLQQLGYISSYECVTLEHWKVTLTDGGLQEMARHLVMESKVNWSKSENIFLVPWVPESSIPNLLFSESDIVRRMAGLRLKESNNGYN